MGVSTLACTCIGMRMTIYTRGFLHVISIKQVFSGPQEADLLTEVRVFCVPICDLYIPNRYCGQMPEKTIIYASAHSKNSCARHVFREKSMTNFKCNEHYALLFESLLKRVCEQSGQEILKSVDTAVYNAVLDRYEDVMAATPTDLNEKREAFNSALKKITNLLHKILVDKNSKFHYDTFSELLPDKTSVHSVHQLNWILEKASEIAFAE